MNMQFFLEVHECQKLFHYFILILQINIDVAELPIEDDVGQIVDQQQDEYRKHADDDVKSIVSNKPIKASS